MMNLPPWAQALVGAMIGATLFGAVYAAGTALMMLLR